MRLVIGNGAAKAIDDGLASLIARAIATRNMFLAGRDDSIDAMASRLGVRRDYVAVLVRLSYSSLMKWNWASHEIFSRPPELRR